MSRISNLVEVPMNGSPLRMDVLVFARAYTTLRDIEDRRRGSRALPIEAEGVLAQFAKDPDAVRTAQAMLAARHPTIHALWASLLDVQDAIVRDLPTEVERTIDCLNTIRAEHRSGRTVRHPLRLAA